MTADQMLTMNMVAQRLAISLRTAQRRIATGEITWVNIAPPDARRASIRVAESALARYLEARRVAT